MKVLSKQRNSRMCIICGLDNPGGVKAHFYNMEDGSVMSRFKFSAGHQSYPGRVHGGMISAMLDEMGLRTLWMKPLDEVEFGVTMSLNVSFRRPVPYGEILISRGELIRNSRRFAAMKASIFDVTGQLLADSEMRYIKLDPKEIAPDASMHEEMPYLIEDDITEIDL